MDTFPLLTAPDWGLESSPETNIEEQPLGDGYVLRRPKGINYIRETWSPSWSHLSQAECEATYAWLKTRLNLVAFFWTHPTTGISTKVICTTVGMVVADVGIFSLRATFKQDFNL